MIQSLINIYNYIKENKVLLSIVAALIVLLGLMIGIIIRKNNNITIIENNLNAATEKYVDDSLIDFYTKSEIDNKIGDIETILASVVEVNA